MASVMIALMSISVVVVVVEVVEVVAEDEDEGLANKESSGAKICKVDFTIALTSSSRLLSVNFVVPGRYLPRAHFHCNIRFKSSLDASPLTFIAEPNSDPNQVSFALSFFMQVNLVPQRYISAVFFGFFVVLVLIISAITLG